MADGTDHHTATAWPGQLGVFDHPIVAAVHHFFESHRIDEKANQTKASFSRGLGHTWGDGVCKLGGVMCSSISRRGQGLLNISEPRGKPQKRRQSSQRRELPIHMRLVGVPTLDRQAGQSAIHLFGSRAGRGQSE